MAKLNFQSDLGELLNCLKSKSDNFIIEKFTKVLKDILEKPSCMTFESENLALINESIQILTKQIFETQNVSDISNLYLEILLFLSFIKLNFLNESDIEYSSTSLSIISNGIKLVKYFNDIQQYSKAEYFCSKCKATLKSLTDTKSLNEQSLLKNILLEKKLTLDIFSIEALINCNKLNKAFEEISNIKHSIIGFSNHKEYFLSLCYNAGLKILQNQQFENAVVILETVQDVAKDGNEDIHVEINLLLSHIYLKHNPEQLWKKCLNILYSVPKHKLQPCSVLRMVKAALFSKNPTVVKETLQKIAENSIISFSLILKIQNELETNHYETIAAEFLKNMQNLDFSIPEKLHLMSVELKIYFELNSLEKANALLDNALEIVKQFQNNKVPTAVQCLYKEISTYSSAKFTAKSFSESLNWYTKCSQLMEAAGDENALRYVRQRICQCHIELNDVSSAKCVLDGLDLASDPFNLYLAMQMAVKAEDEAMAETVIGHFGKSDANIDRLLLACCKFALDSGKKVFLCKILEMMLQSSPPITEGLLHANVAQCLVRLHLNTKENELNIETILTFLNRGLDCLQKAQTQPASPVDLSAWFSRVSWNLALSPGLEPGAVFRLALLCCRSMEGDRNPALRNALWLTVTAGLQYLRMCREDRDNVARNILLAIDKWRHLETPNSTTASLLSTFEFETRLLSGDPAAETTLKQMVQSVDGKCLRTAAALAYEQSPTNHKLISTALKGVIQKMMEQQEVDCEEISAIYRAMLQVLFHNQELSGVEDEAFKVCQEILTKMGGVLKEYPHIEVVWLMSRCWNRGIQQLATGTHPHRSRDWCSLALQLASTLGDSTGHGTKLTALFAAYFGQPEGSTLDI